MKSVLTKRGASFQYGDRNIEYHIEPRASDINKVLIKVRPDCNVIAQAPVSASDEEIMIAVKKRSRWIHRQLRYFEKQTEYILPRKYVSGESHFYLGRRHLLKVQKCQKAKPEVKLLRGVLEVKTKDFLRTKDLLFDWYKYRAKDVFERRLEQVLPLTPWVTERPPIRVLSMTTQWGSCSPKGKITLNPHLVKASRECIDYVLIHELCHIAEHNHSERFYRLMNNAMPNWKSIKEKLDGMAYFYLNDV